MSSYSHNQQDIILGKPQSVSINSGRLLASFATPGEQMLIEIFLEDLLNMKLTMGMDNTEIASVTIEGAFKGNVFERKDKKEDPIRQGAKFVDIVEKIRRDISKIKKSRDTIDIKTERLRNLFIELSSVL